MSEGIGKTGIGMRFQTAVRIGLFVLLLLSSGCVQVIRIEEGTEGVLYRLRHPTTRHAEINHE